MCRALRRIYTFYISALFLAVVCGVILGAVTQPKEIAPKQIEMPTTAIASVKKGVTNQMEVHTVTFELPTTYLGKFTCTAYCSCSKCCGIYASNRPVDENGNEIVYGASGQILTPNKSVAVDTSIIPLGTVLIIDGKEYIAQDTGAFHGYNIDFYFNNHDEALAFGFQTKEVYIKRG